MLLPDENYIILHNQYSQNEETIYSCSFGCRNCFKFEMSKENKTDNAVFCPTYYKSHRLRFLFAGKYGAFDYISVTPPYMEVDYGILMNQVSKSSVVGEDTFIVSQFLYFILDISFF